MFRINEAKYRKEHKLSRDDPVPPVDIVGGLPTVLHEFQQEGESCFVDIAAQFYLRNITLEDYFDRLLNHLAVDGTRHTFDHAKFTKVAQLLMVDLIGGTVKSMMLNKSFARLDAIEAAKLKTLCLMAYRDPDPEDLRRKAAAAGTPLVTLPPRWRDLLAVIAYARRHLAALQHLVTYPAPSTKSTFDLLTADIISTRQRPTPSYPTVYLQHSPRRPRSDRLTEIRIWTALLTSPGHWIHSPLKTDREALHGGLLSLLDFTAATTSPSQARLRDSPALASLCRALSAKGIYPDAATLSHLLSLTEGSDPTLKAPGRVSPCSLAAAETFLSCFPLPHLRRQDGGGLNKGDSATVLFPLTRWPRRGNGGGDRLVVMRALLGQGYDPDAGFQRATRAYELSGGTSALRLAEEGADGEMVTLLREFGAGRPAGGGDDDAGGRRIGRKSVVGNGRKRKAVEAELPARRGKIPRCLRDTGVGAEPEGMDFFG